MSYEVNLFKPLQKKSLSESAEIILESDSINALPEEEFEQQKVAIQKKLTRFQEGEVQLEQDSDFLQLTSSTFTISIFMSSNQITAQLRSDIGESTKAAEMMLSVVKDIANVTGYGAYDPQSDSELYPAMPKMFSRDDPANRLYATFLLIAVGIIIVMVTTQL